MAKRKSNMNLTPLQMYSLVVKGTLKTFPNNYLDREKIKEIVRFLILKSYKYTKEDVLFKVDCDFMQRNFLGGAKKFFNTSLIELLIYCFPEWKLKAWEFRKVPQRFWANAENRRVFVLWIAEKEKINLDCKENYRKITADVILKYGGTKAMRHAGGLYELLNEVACDRYKKWEITRVFPWHDDDIIPAIKWLVEEKLKCTPEGACNITRRDFKDNNLDGLLQKVSGRSVFGALNLAYPGRYYRVGRQRICIKSK